MSAVATVDELPGTSRRWTARGWQIAKVVAVAPFVLFVVLFFGGMLVLFHLWIATLIGLVVGLIVEGLVNLALPSHLQLDGQLVTAISVVVFVAFLLPAVIGLLGDLIRPRRQHGVAPATTPVPRSPQPRPEAFRATPAPPAQSKPRLPAPEVARSTEPRIGHRYWRLHPVVSPGSGELRPVLASVWRRYQWQSAEETAKCHLDSYPESHPAPDLGCQCGIYALKETAGPRWGEDPVMARASLELYGRVFEGAWGYRAERARIVGPIAVSYRCAVFSQRGCLEGPVVVVTDEGAYHPRCQVHAESVGPAMTVDDFEWHVRMGLELQYGVEVAIGAGSEHR